MQTRMIWFISLGNVPVCAFMHAWMRISCCACISNKRLLSGNLLCIQNKSTTRPRPTIQNGESPTPIILSNSACFSVNLFRLSQTALLISCAKAKTGYNIKL